MGSVPTRRDTIKHGGSAAITGFLAGCTGAEPTPATEAGGTDTPTPSPTDPGYAVTMAPMGEVTFDAVPRDVFTVFPWYADMAVALGRGDSINSLGHDLLTLWGMTSSPSGA